MPRINVSLGVPPEHAEAFDASVEQAFREAAADKRVRAIGSCGLASCDSKVQLAAFERQVVLAKELDLPLIVQAGDMHSGTVQSGVGCESLASSANASFTHRQAEAPLFAKPNAAADDETEPTSRGRCLSSVLEILQAHGIPADRVLLRAGSMPAVDLAPWARWGSYVAFGPRAANNPAATREIAELFPKDRIMVESGAPNTQVRQLAGYPARTDQVVFVAEALIDMCPATQLAVNHAAFFGLPLLRTR